MYVSRFQSGIFLCLPLPLPKVFSLKENNAVYREVAASLASSTPSVVPSPQLSGVSDAVKEEEKVGEEGGG